MASERRTLKPVPGIHDLVAMQLPALDAGSGVGRWVALRSTDRLLRRFGQADVLRLAAGAQLRMKPRDTADEVWVLIEGKAERGVLICGSGVGACVAANKFPGIRAAVCHDTFSAHQGVEDDNMNVLCLGARVVGPELAKEIARTFLGAVFSKAERHVRRVGKIGEIEKEFMKKIPNTK